MLKSFFSWNRASSSQRERERDSEHSSTGFHSSSSPECYCSFGTKKSNGHIDHFRGSGERKGIAIKLLLQCGGECCRILLGERRFLETFVVARCLGLGFPIKEINNNNNKQQERTNYETGSFSPWLWPSSPSIISRFCLLFFFPWILCV